MMRKLLSFVLLASMVVGLVSCNREKKPVLHIYNWGDYMADSVVKKFENEFNCKVVIDVFDSNEAMYAKLKAGAGGYDVIVPSSYMAKLMNEQGMLQQLDHSKLPNIIDNFDTKYSNLLLDSKMEYCVPYFVSFTGIGYNPAKVPNFEPSWRMFERTDIAKRCSLLNDQREAIGCALATLGYSVNSTSQEEIDQAVELLCAWKKNIAKFEVDDAKRSLASDEFFLIQNYSGDMLQVMMERPEIKFVIPKEGSTVTFDTFAITANSTNTELAYKFINFMYRDDICAENMNEIMYVTPNVSAYDLVDPELKSMEAFNMPAEDMARCQPLQDLGDENVKYIHAWDKIREE